MIRLRRVNPLGRWQDILGILQAECLPADVPYPYKDRDLWWVATDDGEPVGFAVVSPLSHGLWYMSRAGVVPSARGHGLQKRLIRVRLRAARSAGAAMVITDCTAANVASANSLIACGLRPYTPAHKWALPDSIYWRTK